MITVNTKHVHVNSLSFNSVLFYFLQDFQLIAWWWLKAKELSATSEFKASVGWYNNWKRFQAVSMRAKTTLAQRLPADMEDKRCQIWSVGAEGPVTS